MLKNYNKITIPYESIGGGSGKWSASSNGTSEYHYTVDVFVKPLFVSVGGINLTEGTVGSLAAGEWGWGDNDTVGYEVLYIRLSDSSDPELQASDAIKTSVFHTILETEQPENIIFGLRVSDNSTDHTHSAKCILAVTDIAGFFEYTEMFTVNASESPVSIDSKLVLNENSKLKVMTDTEKVSVSVSIDIN